MPVQRRRTTALEDSGFIERGCWDLGCARLVDLVPSHRVELILSRGPIHVVSIISRRGSRRLPNIGLRASRKGRRTIGGDQGV